MSSVGWQKTCDNGKHCGTNEQPWLEKATDLRCAIHGNDSQIYKLACNAR